ncbi:hypothetical protein M6B38_373740 [Iris pallida]|uniref:Uncharacterized protein n=1 Tax=Iris pallida TaxID=29817 RepID=A0AAX6ETK1_IRIPA|nr:hypothetical protein M6B38_173225 [Iris pallida]KAJ6826147.1 hypothetical protein M6B38_373740 [Iris pallida]
MEMPAWSDHFCLEKNFSIWIRCFVCYHRVLFWHYRRHKNR